MTARLVGGTGRCGSSLLGDLLGRHPETVYVHESRLFGAMCAYANGGSFSAFEAKVLRNTRRFVLPHLREYGYGPLAREVYARTRVQAYLSAARQRSVVKEVQVRAFVSLYFGALGFPCWLEKTPHTILIAGQLARLFPGLRYAHVIRNPADVCASVLRKGWGPNSVPRFVRWYNRLMVKAWDERVDVPRGHYLVVSLESLIADPARTLAVAARFFELPVPETVELQDAHIGRAKRELSQADRNAIRKGCGEAYGWWKQEAI